MLAIETDRGRIKKWIKTTTQDRCAQAVMVELITNTAGRVGGTNLRCPECDGENQLTLKHILEQCRYIQTERADAALYSKAPEPITPQVIKKNPKLLPNIMEASSSKIRHLITTAREKHYAQRQHTDRRGTASVSVV